MRGRTRGRAGPTVGGRWLPVVLIVPRGRRAYPSGVEQQQREPIGSQKVLEVDPELVSEPFEVPRLEVSNVLHRDLVRLAIMALDPVVIHDPLPALPVDLAQVVEPRRYIRAAGKLKPGTDVVILGCAGAVEIISEVNAALPYRVLDGVTCAGRLCRALLA